MHGQTGRCGVSRVRPLGVLCGVQRAAAAVSYLQGHNNADSANIQTIDCILFVQCTLLFFFCFNELCIGRHLLVTRVSDCIASRTRLADDADLEFFFLTIRQRRLRQCLCCMRDG